MFSPDDIQARLRRRPFIPIHIVTTTGQTYDIHHPELMMVGRHYVIVGMPSQENPTQFEQDTLVAIIHLTEIKDLPMSTPSQDGAPA